MAKLKDNISSTSSSNINIYNQKQWWKYLLIVALLIIVIASIVYSNFLARKLAKEERKKMELMADIFKRINTNASTDNKDNQDESLMLEIIQSNTTVPLILTDDKGNIISFKNLDSAKAVNDTAYVPSKLREMKQEKPAIPIEYSANSRNYIYYEDSYLLTQLIYFPYITFGIILIFLVVAYLAFSTARRAEQNRVWVGMAKETAHQLGTPLSSLSGWLDYIQDQVPVETAQKIVPEMQKDLVRLDLIADRFSKIGSVPVLKKIPVYQEIEKNVSYIRRRASGKVEFTIHHDSDRPVMADISPSLFDWVLENLMKNALDAMSGSGRIDIYISQKPGQAIVDIKDTGKGIASSKFNTVFEPGYSTKTRGWGLGLSLSKRIIQNYHSGKIFVKESAPNKGTTFRIVLNNK